jgi:hypothetical protein
VLDDHAQLVPGEPAGAEVPQPQPAFDQVVLDGLLMLVEEI